MESSRTRWGCSSGRRSPTKVMGRRCRRRSSFIWTTSGTRRSRTWNFSRRKCVRLFCTSWDITSGWMRMDCSTAGWIDVVKVSELQPMTRIGNKRCASQVLQVSLSVTRAAGHGGAILVQALHRAFVGPLRHLRGVRANGGEFAVPDGGDVDNVLRLLNRCPNLVEEQLGGFGNALRQFGRGFVVRMPFLRVRQINELWPFTFKDGLQQRSRVR